jgi:tetratricopeptide (TPR) repeat protein
VAASIPSSTDGRFLQAVDGLISLNDAADAQTAVNAGRSRYAGSPLLHLAIADFDVSLGRDVDARTELVTATQLASVDQDKVRADSSLCHFDVLRHDYPDAIAECTNAVRVNANGAGAYDDRSVAELVLGNPTAAISDLSRAIGAFNGNVGPDAQAAGIDGFGAALLLEARARADGENGMFSAARTDYHAALDALPPGTPDFAARLKDELDSVPS